MSYYSGLNQKVKEQILYNNSSTITYDNEETNLSLLASLKYVQDFTNYYIYLTYLTITNPIFSGLMTGNNININGYLSTPTINNITNFTSRPTLNNQLIEYDIIGEIKLMTNEIPPNYLVCDGSALSVNDYFNLFLIIGYTYGGEDETFNLPDARSHYLIGGNNTNTIGCATSNFVYGNNEQGAYNNYTPSSYFGGAVEPEPPILQKIYSHNHSITDNGHLHASNLQQNFNKFVSDDLEPVYLPIGQLPSSVAPEVVDEINFCFISINNNGDQIQQTDPISNLNGVNISPPYLSVKICICYNQN
jgi:hypothetical protein